MKPLVNAQPWLTRLNAAAARLDRTVQFMEVCGTHTMSAARSGLHSLLPDNVRLLTGPGCPVCVTAQGDIDMMIGLALDHDVTLCTYGDMLRVPGARGSLEQARGQGADVRAVYSTLDAVRLAARQPDRPVVFAAVGFETTAPATAAAVLHAQAKGIRNFSVLVSHKRVLPAMLALLEAGDVAVDGFLCPGHVSVIIGSEPYRPIVRDFGLSCVVTGFEDLQMAAGLARLTELAAFDAAELINDYPEAVTAQGNPAAQRLLERVFEPASVGWRALGEIPDSGLVLRPALAQYDAALRFALTRPEDREPGGCRCGDVICGRASPDQCDLFGAACNPVRPIGPCMVSTEGACQAWFRYHRPARGRKPQASPDRTASPAPASAPTLAPTRAGGVA